jgi:limonene-1,2-epoxide hydrolase
LKRNPNTRQLVHELVAARNAGSTGDVARLLRPDVSYWDCRRGRLDGREQVAAALTDPVPAEGGARFELDTLVAGPGHAVAELSVSARSFAFATTEVYEVAQDGIATCRSYLDPTDLPRAS